MKFCDSCGNLMRVKNDEDGRSLHCRICDIKKPLTDQLTIEVKNDKADQKIVVIDDKEESEFPVTNTMCPECGDMREAYWTMQQTRGGDEPPTRFYQCKTCNHRWREYS
ncbi:MAG: transcription factor S [Candidatus Aenigmarchaeota archaeon]|nr:transcription factor S [Candidatus Aenigmarchaeota archaeon]